MVCRVDAPDERAARLLGASRAVWRSSGAHVVETTPYSHSTTGPCSGSGRRSVPSFDAAFAEGASYTLEQAVALALGDDDERLRAPPRPPGAAGAGLTRREWEIAGLLAEGLSNKEIAARLVISQRTAETHVDHILSKLGLTSRAQVASWAAEQRAH